MNPSSRQTPGLSRRPLKLFHTSDLHVGNDFYPDASLRGFDAVLNTMQQVSADVLLIAGDLFDSQRVPTDAVTYVFRSLADLGRPVVLLPGNHDTVLTARSSPVPDLPANLHIFREPAGEVICIVGLDLALWGRPVYDHVPEFRPLAGLEPRPPRGWYVAMGHGLVLDGNADRGRSSPIVAEELAQADCDYIALGHVHQFRDVTQGRAPAFYSGAPSGSLEPTAALVTLDPAKGVSIQTAHL